MNIRQGFQIDEPNVFINWLITESELTDLLGDYLKRVTDGYYTINCKSMGGLEHFLGFHFHLKKDGLLTEFEIFPGPDKNLEKAYLDSRKHLISAFGEADIIKPGGTTYEGFDCDYHEWHIGDITIIHFVHYRFGTEQVLRIKHAT